MVSCQNLPKRQEVSRKTVTERVCKYLFLTRICPTALLYFNTVVWQSEDTAKDTGSDTWISWMLIWLQARVYTLLNTSHTKHRLRNSVETITATNLRHSISNSEYKRHIHHVTKLISWNRKQHTFIRSNAMLHRTWAKKVKGIKLTYQLENLSL